MQIPTGAANGIAQGQGSAYAAGNAQEHSLKGRGREVGQEATQAKAVKGKKEEVNHLGIEG